VGAELFHADRVTDRHDEANRRYSRFCERPQKVDCYLYEPRAVYIQTLPELLVSIISDVFVAFLDSQFMFLLLRDGNAAVYLCFCTYTYFSSVFAYLISLGTNGKRMRRSWGLGVCTTNPLVAGTDVWVDCRMWLKHCWSCPLAFNVKASSSYNKTNETY